MSSNSKQFRWYNLSLLLFTVVWGFGNVVNNYANLGLQVIVSWVIILSLYFVPYALMVGEMGSTFNKSIGGVSEWIKQTCGPTVAFLAGWTYWVVHVPYLAQKPQAALIAVSWAIFKNGVVIKTLNPLILQSLTLVCFLGFLVLASRGVNSLKKIGIVAGTSMLIMSILFILLMLAAPALRGVHSATTDWGWHTFIPNFDFTYFTTISMLLFAVGGCEKLAPYVNNTHNPAKEFPKAMIAVAGLVAVSALLGSFAMGLMFDAHNLPKDLKMNGQYYAFQLLGQYYGLGNSLMIIYALANGIGQIAALMFSIDAPIKVFLGEANPRFVPNFLNKKNKHGAPINGYILTAILVSILIIVPAFGIKNINDLFNWLLDLNSIVMPMRYLWVFVAYIAIKKLASQFNSDYQFVKNRQLGMTIGIWCFGLTIFAILMGMFPKGITMYSHQWYFQLTLNIITPFGLLALGFIMPIIAKFSNNQTT